MNDKKLEKEIKDAAARWELWEDIAEDDQALADRGKTREQAMHLAGFFEGRFTALLGMRGSVVRSDESKKRRSRLSALLGAEVNEDGNSH